jgi:hypothetical protein
MNNNNSRASLRFIPVAMLVAAGALGFANTASAESVVVPVSAKVLTPITVSEVVPLRFGSVAAGATNGTVVLTIPASIPATLPTSATPSFTGRTVTGGAILVGGGTCSAANACGVASLQLKGESGSSFSTVTLPATVSLTITGGGTETMTVGSFTKRYGVANTAGVTTGAATLTGGTGLVYIGGSLTVATGQATGTYAGDVTVSVDY